MNGDSIVDRVTRFLRVPAVVGHEEPFLDLLEVEVGELGRPVSRRDGLLAVPGGPATVSAHVDRHGFVTGDRDGRLRYAASEIGAHRHLSPKLAAAICSRFEHEWVYAYDAAGTILAEGVVNHADHCGIGDGLDLVATGLAGVAPATPVAFAATVDWDGEWLRGQLDNALSAAIAVELLAVGFEGTVLFILGEESGRSWEALADWFDQPADGLFVLDTSPFDDDEPVLAGAVVLRHADAGAVFDIAATERAEAAAHAVGAPVVWKDDVLAAAAKPLGRTELGRLIAGTDGRVTGTTVQVPTTEYHTNHESTARPAIEAVSGVLGQLFS